MPVLQYVCPACGRKFEELVKKFDDPVVCPACGAAVSPNAKFCPECGKSLLRACPACGAALSANAKFCPECGQKL